MSIPLLAIALSVPLILWVDLPLADHLRHHLHIHWQGFFKVLTDLGLAGHWFLLAGVGALWCVLRAKSALFVVDHDVWIIRARGWAYMLATLAVSGLAVTLLKMLFGRFRPRVWFDQATYSFAPLSFVPDANSFPSGHSQVAAAVCTCLVVLFPRHWLTWVLMSGTIILSRTATTVHYFSDTVAGAALGFAVAWALKRQMERRYGPLRPPQAI